MSTFCNDDEIDEILLLQRKKQNQLKRLNKMRKKEEEEAEKMKIPQEIKDFSQEESYDNFNELNDCSENFKDLRNPHSYLKKGEGKLASHYYGETDFSKKRKDEIIKQQYKLEYNPYYIKDPFKYKYRNQI